MERTAAGSGNSETEPRADGQRNWLGGPEAQESNEFLKTVLEICTGLGNPELRRRFSGFVNSSCEEKQQVCALDLYDLMERLTESIWCVKLLDEKKKLEDELAKERQVSKTLKQEVKRQRLQVF